jgi:hypothetical protein
MTLETLTMELEAIKQLNRRLWLALGALAIVLALALSGRAVAQGTPQTLKAESFVVVDDGGNVRARLERDPRGSARLTFFRADGTRTFMLSGDQQAFPLDQE